MSGALVASFFIARGQVLPNRRAVARHGSRPLKLGVLRLQLLATVSARIQAEEEIADCRAPAVSDPPLCQMVRPIVQHVAALTERAQILQSIVGRIAVQVRRCEHDARHPKPRCLHKVGPAGRPSSTIPPCRRLLVEPAAPVGSEGGQGVVGHNVGIFLQRARSGRGCSARASMGDRAVAAQGGLASLCRLMGSSPHIDAGDDARTSWACVSESDDGTRLSFPSTDPGRC